MSTDVEVSTDSFGRSHVRANVGTPKLWKGAAYCVQHVVRSLLRGTARRGGPREWLQRAGGPAVRHTVRHTVRLAAHGSSELVLGAATDCTTSFYDMLASQQVGKRLTTKIRTAYAPHEHYLRNPPLASSRLTTQPALFRRSDRVMVGGAFPTNDKKSDTMSFAATNGGGFLGAARRDRRAKKKNKAYVNKNTAPNSGDAPPVVASEAPSNALAPARLADPFPPAASTGGYSSGFYSGPPKNENEIDKDAESVAIAIAIASAIEKPITPAAIATATAEPAAVAAAAAVPIPAAAVPISANPNAIARTGGYSSGSQSSTLNQDPLNQDPHQPKAAWRAATSRARRGHYS